MTVAHIYYNVCGCFTFEYFFLIPIILSGESLDS